MRNDRVGLFAKVNIIKTKDMIIRKMKKSCKDKNGLMKQESPERDIEIAFQIKRYGWTS
jgi:hypothetical protein